MAACRSCGTKLSFFGSLLGKSLCPDCTKREAEAAAAAQEEFRTFVGGIASSTTSAAEIREQFPVLAERSGLSDADRRALVNQSFESYVTEALADDCLTENEEQRLFELADAMGIDGSSYLADIMPRLVVARVNDGRLPIVSEPNVMLKKDELAHAEMRASLMKEVKVREYQGGYSGFSFRIAKGVRYHTGGTRGRSVVVGTTMQVEDEGVLSVTSQRAVFLGRQKTVEFSYKKIVNLTLFTDGVRFHVSNRQRAHLLQLDPGHSDVVAAIVNVASQPFLE